MQKQGQGKPLSLTDIAKMIDHSLLRPDIDSAELADGFEMARKYHVATVCVRPYDVERAVEAMADSDVRVSSTVGFPHGANTVEIKVREAEALMDLGVKDLDMVLPIGPMKSADFDYVKRDIAAVVAAGHARSAIVKVIFDNVYLAEEEIVKACQICEAVGADFVKTSTGYSPGGASLADVRLMRDSCGPGVEVKAAGGIRTLDDVLRYRAAGASMIGTRSTEQILEEAAERDVLGTLREIATD